MFRTELKFKLICNICGSELLLEGIESSMNSAYDLTGEIKVEPCANCVSKAKNTIKTINELVSNLNRVIK